MTESTRFANPPVIEFVLGVQFSPIEGATNWHLAQFSNELGPDWMPPTDGPRIQEQFETFGIGRRGHPKLEMLIAPAQMVNRFLFENRAKDRLIQLQPTRLHLNWKKTAELKPSYGQLIDEFENTFSKLCSFCERIGLGSIQPNQWELTYVDSFPKDEYWNELGDWSRFMPGLFGELFSTEKLGLILDRRQAEWSFEIAPQRGRLHISANRAVLEGGRETLLVNSTARGPIGADKEMDLRSGLDLGHQVAVDAFLRIVPAEIKAKWEPTNV